MQSLLEPWGSWSVLLHFDVFRFEVSACIPTQSKLSKAICNPWQSSLCLCSIPETSRSHDLAQVHGHSLTKKAHLMLKSLLQRLLRSGRPSFWRCSRSTTCCWNSTSSSKTSMLTTWLRWNTISTNHHSARNPLLLFPFFNPPMITPRRPLHACTYVCIHKHQSYCMCCISWMQHMHYSETWWSHTSWSDPSFRIDFFCCLQQMGNVNIWCGAVEVYTCPSLEVTEHRFLLSMCVAVSTTMELAVQLPRLTCWSIVNMFMGTLLSDSHSDWKPGLWFEV